MWLSPAAVMKFSASTPLGIDLLIVLGSLVGTR
jgi:hypothetical protein